MKLIKALKKIVYINFFLLFSRDNWFRKYLLNDLKLQKLINGSLSGDTEDLLDNLFNLSNSRLKQAMFNKPFNDQKTRKEIVKEILESIQFDKIIETGTLLGNTTEFFQKFNIPVLSIEISEFYFLVSKIRFIDKENVSLINSNSSDYFNKLTSSEEKIFFYLDAHSQEHIPLMNELSKCLEFKNSIILIDDFKVPENKSFGYDVYKGKELSLKNYEILKNYDLYFPNYNPDRDNGSRGYVIVDISGENKNVFLNINYLDKLN